MIICIYFQLRLLQIIQMSLGKSKLDKSNSYKQLQPNPSSSRFQKVAPNKLLSSSSNRLPQGQLNLVVRSRSKDIIGNKSTFKLYVGNKKDSSTPKGQIANNQASLKSSRKQNINPNLPTQNKAAKGKTFKEVRLAVSKPSTIKPKAQIKREMVGKAEQMPSIAQYIPSGIIQTFKKVVLDDFVILRETQQEQHSNQYLAIHSKLNWLFTIKKFNKNVIIEQQLLGQLVESLKIHFYLNNLESAASIQKIYTIFCDTTAVYLVLEPIYNDQHETTCVNADQTIKGFNKMLSALALTHQNRIVFRNLTAKSIKNVMGVLKITNIVRATVLRQDRKRQSFFGSLHQTPHQLIIGQSYDTSYDMWSLGLVLYQTMLNLSPFSENMGIEQIKSLQFKLPIELPNGLALAISSLLCEKQKRLSAQQCLRVEYLKGQGKDYNLVNRDIYNFWMFQ